MKTLVIAFALAAAFTTAACKKDKDKAEGGGGGTTTSAPKVDVSPEMQAFMAGIKGKSTDVEAAIKAHGVDGLDHKDMTMYDLSSPKVTATNKNGDKTCYTFDAKAGMTTRTYDVCWTGGKISEVADKGMR
ncbi:MAG: hypothetical protein M4D80_13600 [Myxococcota bacterium]|nr:hypothetical protein [Myxococcota bacterium]